MLKHFTENSEHFRLFILRQIRGISAYWRHFSWNYPSLRIFAWWAWYGAAPGFSRKCPDKRPEIRFLPRRILPDIGDEEENTHEENYENDTDGDNEDENENEFEELK